MSTGLELLASIISGLLLVSGFFFLAVGTIGLVRLPDTYTRLHATGKCDTLGALLIVVGCMFIVDGVGPAAKLLAVAMFLWIINPATAHMIARVARATGVPMCPGTSYGTDGEGHDGRRGASRAR